jgi:hypothetical protein
MSRHADWTVDTGLVVLRPEAGGELVHGASPRWELAVDEDAADAMAR